MDPLIEAGVALVTGAGSGIGQAIAIGFAKSGCKRLFLADINLGALEETQSLIQKDTPEAKTTLFKANVSEKQSVQDMIAKCVEVYGRLDFACNNAGVGATNTKTADLSVEAFDRVNSINAQGVFLCQKYEIKQMLEQTPLIFNDHRAQKGSIINTASMNGIAVLGTLPGYNASKHAVVSMTRVDARTFAPEGIRVNCICPGFVETPMLTGSGLEDKYIEAAKAQNPSNRLMKAIEIANGVVFLAGSLASGITGIHLPIDGGGLLFHVV
ncbi:putative oxidoreductase [Lachnellula hyalina]|uniref:Putative oxidoreductase n=1 Tax=Lachnellula hyalina TaxID=1316788 RepID=A0A8H8QY25_9HELO|nr:putative oxidoreductase [Lachnellula hyalina]TVY24863.1 putative oxidoreductase [Lachnellula hyalina]